MYKLVRIIGGVTETLKDSNSQQVKTFSDSVAAQALANKLNAHLLQNHSYWTVESFI